MAEIVVHRRSALWQDRGRDYRIVIDGAHAGSVANGEKIRIAVAPGRHTVRMQIDWCWSPEVVVDVGTGMEHVFACGPNANPFLAVLYITLWKNKYLWLRESGAGALPAAA
jgi:hypothetical protein